MVVKVIAMAAITGVMIVEPPRHVPSAMTFSERLLRHIQGAVPVS
jgi:hypothetical protein